MKDNFDRSVWINYFNEFTRRNQARPTRLEVFGEMGAQEEERGLPFTGIALDTNGNALPSVEIMFGGHDTMEPRHLTHVIANVQDITPKRGLDGRDEALQIISALGETSLLRFEPAPKATESGSSEWSFRQSPLNVLSSIALPPPRRTDDKLSGSCDS